MNREGLISTGVVGGRPSPRLFVSLSASRLPFNFRFLLSFSSSYPPLSVMLLIHKPHHPTSPSLMSPIKLSQQHRRNPSAPAAVVNVLPTKTPGLLSLSRPAQRAAQHHNQLPRIATPRQPRTRPAPVVNTLVQQVQVSALSPSPSPEKTRGRSHPARDKPARSVYFPFSYPVLCL